MSNTQTTHTSGLDSYLKEKQSAQGKKKKKAASQGVKVRSNSVSSNASRKSALVKVPSSVEHSQELAIIRKTQEQLAEAAMKKMKFMTAYTAWNLSLLRHLKNGVVYPLPSATFSGLGFSSPSDFMSLLAPSYSNNSGIIIPSNTVYNNPSMTSLDARYLAMGNDIRTTGVELSRARELSYFTVTGKVTTTIPLSGNEGIWVWVDPYDAYNPVRFNSGDYAPVSSGAPNPYWKGALVAGISPTPYSITTVGGVSGCLGWTQNPFSQYATNWICQGAESLYPFVNGLPDLIGTSQPIVVGTSYLIYPIEVKLSVCVADNTAYTQTGMRVRGCRTASQHRLLNRVEDVGSGYYGLTEPFVKANAASAVWSGDSWSLPVRHPIPSAYTPPVAPTWPSTPTEATNGTSAPGASTAQINWMSLQKMLSQDFPVIEIVQSSPNSTVATTALSISVEVRYGISPLGLGSANPAQGDTVTVPYEIPPWFSECRSHGVAYPVDASLAPMVQPPSVRMISAVPHVQVEHPIVHQMQSSISKSPTILEQFESAVDKGLSIFNKVKDAVSPFMPALTGAASALMAL